MLGLRSLGVVRLSQLVELSLEEVGAGKGLALPIREGFVAPGDDGNVPLRARRFWLSADFLKRAQALARALGEMLKKWPGAATLETHGAHATALLTKQLDWKDDARDIDTPGVLVRLSRLPGQGEELTREEFRSVGPGKFRLHSRHSCSRECGIMRGTKMDFAWAPGARFPYRARPIAGSLGGCAEEMESLGDVKWPPYLILLIFVCQLCL